MTRKWRVVTLGVVAASMATAACDVAVDEGALGFPGQSAADAGFAGPFPAIFDATPDSDDAELDATYSDDSTQFFPDGYVDLDSGIDYLDSSLASDADILFPPEDAPNPFVPDDSMPPIGDAMPPSD
jgi:hypothetical protein